ncbi:MAG TPA: hypothetical protein VEJ89_17180 [Myxococcaceae bacterium]|nr:hypothetical protein [Myxococcaceae bacterium]
MSKRKAVVGAALVGSLLAARPAVAVEDAPWTVASAKTVGTGETVFWGQVGFPGIWLELVHGIDATTEIGGKFAFNYSVEGVVNAGVIGLDFQFLLRKQFFDNGKIRIAGTFDPGFLLYFPSCCTFFGITFPIGVQFGFPVSPQVSINASFDLPMYVMFGSGGYSTFFVIPLLFGGGAEYLLEKNLALTFNLKLGPSIVTGSYFGSTQFTLYALFGAAYKFN